MVAMKVPLVAAVQYGPEEEKDHAAMAGTAEASVGGVDFRIQHSKAQR